MVNVNDRVVLEGSIRDSATVHFYGPTQFAAGNWVGLELDHKVGRNDGSIAGIRYFNMIDRGDGINHGLFTRLSNVKPLIEGKNISQDVDPNEIINELRKQIQRKDEEYSLLQKKFNDSTQFYELHTEELQFTVDGLTLKDTDLNAELSDIQKKFHLMKDEYIELKEKMILLEDRATNGEVIEILDVENIEGIEPQELIRQNKYLKSMIKNLENSSNDILQQYEESLTENTVLLKQNIDLKNKLSTLQNENEQNTKMIQDLSDKIGAEENSESIIDYLTEANNTLNDTVKTLNDEINSCKQTIKLLNKSQSNNDISTSKLQTKLESMEIDLSRNVSLLEEEYEKNIILTEKLQTLTDTVYKSQSDEIIKLQNKLKNSEDDINKQKTFKRFAEYYLNLNTVSMDTLLVNLRLFKVILEDNVNNNTKLLSTQYILLFIKILGIIGIYLKDKKPEAAKNMVDDFVKNVIDFNTWKDDILDSKFDPNSYNVEQLISFISNHKLSSNPKLSIPLLNGIFNDIIPSIIGTFRDIVDSNSVSNIYSIVLTNEDLISKVLSEIKDKNVCLEKEVLLQQFDEIMKELFQALLEINVESFTSVMNCIKKYLIIVNQELLTIHRTVIQDVTENISNSNKSKPETSPSQSDKSINNIHNDVINELKLKISVLTEKSNESKLKEGINIQLKDDIQKLNFKLSEETKKVADYNNKLNTATEKLEEVKLDSLQLVKDKKLTGTLMKREDIDKLDLMTEVHYLRNNLLNNINVLNFRNAIKDSDSSFKWLMKDMAMYNDGPCIRSKNQYDSHSSQQFDRNLDRLLDSATNLVSTIQVGLEPTSKDSIKIHERIERHDNIVKNVIDELIYSDN
ncbi:protein Nip100p [Monosporozyma unispora]|nr:hypothetical protein C6P44_003765 [Kazachstania unispora]